MQRRGEVKEKVERYFVSSLLEWGKKIEGEGAAGSLPQQGSPPVKFLPLLNGSCSLHCELEGES